MNQYISHYLKTTNTFPCSFALKCFLGNNPYWQPKQSNFHAKKICDIGFGDGRDLNLFLYLGMKVYGIEPEKEVVNHANNLFKIKEGAPKLQVGTNTCSGFNSNFFDYVYASASIYYLENESVTIHDSLKEVNRILKDNGLFFASFARSDAHVTKGAKVIDKNTLILEDDYYKLRKGQRYHVYNTKEEVNIDLRKSSLLPIYIGNYDIDWFGTKETLFVTISRKIAK